MKRPADMDLGEIIERLSDELDIQTVEADTGQSRDGHGPIYSFEDPVERSFVTDPSLPSGYSAPLVNGAMEAPFEFDVDNSCFAYFWAEGELLRSFSDFHVKFARTPYTDESAETEYVFSGRDFSDPARQEITDFMSSGDSTVDAANYPPTLATSWFTSVYGRAATMQTLRLQQGHYKMTWTARTDTATRIKNRKMKMATVFVPYAYRAA